MLPSFSLFAHDTVERRDTVGRTLGASPGGPTSRRQTSGTLVLAAGLYSGTCRDTGGATRKLAFSPCYRPRPGEVAHELYRRAANVPPGGPRKLPCGGRCNIGVEPVSVQVPYRKSVVILREYSYMKNLKGSDLIV